MRVCNGVCIEVCTEVCIEVCNEVCIEVYIGYVSGYVSDGSDMRGFNEFLMRHFLETTTFCQVGRRHRLLLNNACLPQPDRARCHPMTGLARPDRS